MDITHLQRLIFAAVAEMTRAQQLAAPVLDLCTPGVVDEKKRAELRTARYELARASIYALAAMERIQQASAMIATYLKPVEAP